MAKKRMPERKGLSPIDINLAARYPERPNRPGSEVTISLAELSDEILIVLAACDDDGIMASPDPKNSLKEKLFEVRGITASLAEINEAFIAMMKE